MAITSEIIGKLGGAGVEETPVAGREITAANTPIHTIEVPAGKQVLATFIIRFSKIPASPSYYPSLRIGNTQSICGSTSYDVAISAVLTQTSALTVTAGAGVHSGTISGGTVYTAEM